MKITLNAMQYKENSSGIGQLAYNLYNALINRLYNDLSDTKVDIVVSKNSPPLLDKPYDFVTLKEIPFQKESYIKRNLYELFLMGKFIDKDTDIYFSVDSKLPAVLPGKLKKVIVVTDMAVYRMGDVYQASRALYWKHLFKHSIKKADKVIAISRFTKNEIVDITGIDPERVNVIYCGTGKGFRTIEDRQQLESVREKYKLNDRFILFVGTFSPRKNLYRLIKAFKLLKEEYAIPHKLVIVGEKGWKFNRETELLRHEKVAEDVVFPGYIPDEDLPFIYNIADITVYPSVYEGFGLPVIESMACGTPVALSSSSCLPEIAGDTALYFNPMNEKDMAEKMYKLLTDNLLYNEIKAKGLKRAKMYSWDKAAGELLDVFESFDT